MKNSIYKSAEAKAEIMRLYDERLAACNISYKEVYVDTFAGKTHVIITGNKTKPAVVVLHGINAGAPMALQAVKGLADEYCIYALDTVGQATKSAETRLPMNGDSYGRWVAETMDGLGLQATPVIGISYGGFILQKVVSYFPQKVSKAIFVVPGGFVNGPFFKSMQHLTVPLIRFMVTKSEAKLVNFMRAFYNETDEAAIGLQKNVLLGVKVDYTRPALLTKKDVAGFTSPVYAMVADDDIFFPGPETVARCKVLFSNFKEAYVLKNSKHIPGSYMFPEIEEQIRKWLCA